MTFKRLIKARIIGADDVYYLDVMDSESNIERTGPAPYGECLQRLEAICSPSKYQLVEYEASRENGRIFLIIDEFEAKSKHYEAWNKIPTLWCPPVLPTPDYCRDLVSSTLRVPFGPSPVGRIRRP